MRSVSDWTVNNLLNRVKPIPERGEQWLLKFVADFIHTTTQQDWGLCYRWAMTQQASHIQMLRFLREGG